MELVKFNLNYNVRVRIKDKGIEHYVRKYNEIMPFYLHTSFKEFKQKADADGYHTMQMHSFMDDFGCVGLRLAGTEAPINFGALFVSLIDLGTVGLFFQPLLDFWLYILSCGALYLFLW